MTKALADFKSITILSVSLLLSFIWSIPDTIALRYFFMAILIVIVMFSRVEWRILGVWSRLLLIFGAYIFLHAVFSSTDYEIDFQSYWKEWLKFVVISFMGAGVGLLIAKRSSKNLLLYFGVAFSIPLVIHLFLFLYRWGVTGGFPWGYWGINKTHGDLAYASLHAGTILSGYFLWQARRNTEKLISGILLLICVLSPLLASSRGGVIFVLLTMLVSIPIYFYGKGEASFSPRNLFLSFTGSLLVVVLLFNVAAKFDPVRWSDMVSRFSIGFEGDPIAIICHGTSELRKEFEGKGIVDEHLSSLIDGINGGDGSRIMTARAGLKLLEKHPLGIGGSQHAYQIAINQVCDPVIKMAHTHNAWIDTALAIGIPGALLFLVVMLGYFFLGFKAMRMNSTVRPFGAVLFLLASVWIIRGLFDGTHRDHMLEMQAFTFALLAAQILVLARRNECSPS